MDSDPPVLRSNLQRRGEDGFTLIELLVVVVVIGVLIAIAIPLYLNYRKGAENRAAASDLRGAISTVQQCYVDSSTYPTAINAAGTTLRGCKTPTAGVKLSAGTTFVYRPNSKRTATAYNLWAAHGTNGVYYCYASAAGGSIKTEKTLARAYVAKCP